MASELALGHGWAAVLGDPGPGVRRDNRLLAAGWPVSTPNGPNALPAYTPIWDGTILRAAPCLKGSGNPPGPAPRRVSRMQRFVACENIRRFEHLLLANGQPCKRAIINALLESERGKLLALSRQRQPDLL